MKAIVIRAAKVLIAIGVVAFLVLSVVTQWSKLDDVDLHFHLAWIVAAFLALFVFQAIHGELSLMMLRRLGHPVPAQRGRVIFAAALLARYVPTGALSFAVRISMLGRLGIPKRVAGAAIIYEIALSIAGAVLVTLGLAGKLDWAETAVLAAGAVATFVVLHPRVFAPLAGMALKRAGREPLQDVLGFGSIVLLTALYSVSFLVAGLSILCLAHGIVDVPAGSTATLVCSFALGFITGLLGFALPGGLGAREAGITAALTLILPGPVAFALAAASRLLQTAIELTYAGLATALGRSVDLEPAAGGPPAPGRAGM